MPVRMNSECTTDQNSRKPKSTVINSNTGTSGVDPEAFEASAAPRFIIGIDSGTTNHAVSFIDTQQGKPEVQTFPVPQLTAPGQTEALETLPSFVFSPGSELPTGAQLQLPWQKQPPEVIVGRLARIMGAANPGRTVESAKSWLCHPGVDRRAEILPWHTAEDVVRMSPVDAIAFCLRQIRDAWDATHVQAPLAEQDVVITIPASFDEVARELTVAAAHKAGIPRPTLIEEPQAAFYAWIHHHQDSWETQVLPGQTILVCDIGGGTTDFSLIQARAKEGGLEFHRAAVGDHLLLGGDNLDLAIAHYVENLLSPEQPLSPAQWSRLIPEARNAKEILLGQNPPQEYTLALGGGGSRLIGGSLQVTLQQQQILELLIEGFLPAVSRGERPQPRQSGFQEFGLPFASDPAISRYLSQFLSIHAGCKDPQHSERSAPAAPDLVLFNGGFFESPLLQQRVLAVLRDLFSVEGNDYQPGILRNARLDLAVSQGAAAFGLARRGTGVRIVAGLARSYYIGAAQGDGKPAAVCLVPAGTEAAGTTHTLQQTFQVRTAEPVEFPVFTSATRLTDLPGDIIDPDPEQLTALPPVRTILTSRRTDECKAVSARLSAHLTEIGTLQLWCEQTDSSRRWQLQFDVRSAVDTQRVVHMGTAEQSGIVDEEQVQAAEKILREIFAASLRPPDRCLADLSEATAQSREDWPPSLLRAMWLRLMELQEGRRRSAQHEARWLNLAGYCLRPGFGMAADDWRVEELWKLLRGQVLYQHPACLAELRTLCRRISGGFSAARQRQIAAQVLPSLRQRIRQVQSGRGKGGSYASGNHEAAEIWRMLGASELLETGTRIELGAAAIDLSGRKSFAAVQRALIWAVGRMGSRVPVYGPLNTVLPTAIAEEWIRQLLQQEDLSSATVQFALMQLARRTGDRYRDVSESLRDQLSQTLQQQGASMEVLALIREGGQLTQESAGILLGEALPCGLQLC